MKILINRTPRRNQSWGGGNLFVQAAHDLFGEFGYTVVGSLADNPDAVLIVDPRYEDANPSINEIATYKRNKPRAAVIQRLNECDARKGTSDVDAMLLKCRRHVDECVFVSHWLRDYLKNSWEAQFPGLAHARSSDHVIYNGVDKDVFSPARGAPRTDKIRIVTHHWSDNALKGADFTQWLDSYFIPKYRDRFSYTYIGRYKGTLQNTTHVPPCYGIELAEHLASADVYISASRWDPGPNHVIESIACGVPTYVHTNGGGAKEFAGEDHSFSSEAELERLLLSETFVPNTAVEFTDWRACIGKFAAIFDELLCATP